MRPDGRVYLHCRSGQRGHVDLHVEVPGVSQHRAVRQGGDLSRADDLAGAGRGDDHLAESSSGAHRHDPEALHDRAECADGVDLGDEHLGAEPAGALGDAGAARAETCHHDGLACHERVGRAQDAVQYRLTGAVLVIDHPGDRRQLGGDHREAQ